MGLEVICLFLKQPYTRKQNERPRLRLLSPVSLESSQWSKALWKQHPGYEDNYVPPDFLASTRIKFEGPFASHQIFEFTCLTWALSRAQKITIMEIDIDSTSCSADNVHVICFPGCRRVPLPPRWISRTVRSAACLRILVHVRTACPASL